MNYGLYLSASGLLTNSYRQDVYANNLANVNTVGYKPDVPALQARPAEAAEDFVPAGTSHALLDRLGGGVLAGPQRTSFAPGPLEHTGRDLDVALVEPGTFLAVEHVDAEGNASVRLTRDGRLMIDAQGFVVTATGHRVLGPGDGPIAVDPTAELTIARDGSLMQNGGAVGQLQVAAADPYALEKTGSNLFAFRGGDPRVIVDQPDLRVGELEGSGTDAIKTLMSIMASTKAATANANLIKYHDSLMDHAVNTLGRVA